MRAPLGVRFSFKGSEEPSKEPFKGTFEAIFKGLKPQQGFRFQGYVRKNSCADFKRSFFLIYILERTSQFLGLIGPSDGCFSLGRAMGLRSVVLRLHLDRFRGLGVWGLGFRVTFAFLARCTPCHYS